MLIMAWRGLWLLFAFKETTKVAVLAFAPVVSRIGKKKARSDNVNLRARLVAVAGTTLQERRISAIKAARQSKLNAASASEAMVSRRCGAVGDSDRQRSFCWRGRVLIMKSPGYHAPSRHVITGLYVNYLLRRLVSLA